MSEVMMHVNKSDGSAPFMVAIATHPAAKALVEEITRAGRVELQKFPAAKRPKEAIHIFEQLTAFFAQISCSFAINFMKTDAAIGETMAELHSDWLFEQFKAHWARMAPMLDQTRSGSTQ